MSLKPWQERVEHILAAIAEIESFLSGMNRDQFFADPKTLKAVAADLAIVGEAARWIPDAVVELSPEIPWAVMRGMRNRIVHGYYQVDATIVWDTCQNDLPPLIEPLRQLLQQGSDAD